MLRLCALPCMPLAQQLHSGMLACLHQYLNTKYGVDVPLILMNSFKTNEETIKIIRKYSLHNLTIHCFNQSCFPCVDGDHYSPMPTGPFSPETSNMWYDLSFG
jgi:UTP--glucose-1-phosphate uridylyltransferase